MVSTPLAALAGSTDERAARAGSTHGPPAALTPDPRWVFSSDDPTYYSSPWFGGRHRIVIPFGCTVAHQQRGCHHGLDLAMPCGTRLYAARAATVVSHTSLGPAYGTNPLLLHTAGWDLVIGHTRTVYVATSDTVAPGQLIDRASDNGAPDGCHRHVEKRAPGGSLDTARPPKGLLDLAAPD